VKILKLLQANPSLRQRQLAAQLGISLGKANYCLRVWSSSATSAKTRASASTSISSPQLMGPSLKDHGIPNKSKPDPAHSLYPRNKRGVMRLKNIPTKDELCAA